MLKVFLAIFACAAISQAACVTEASNPGCVHFEWKTSPASDQYTNNPDATQQQWFKDHMYRIMWFSGYGDSRLKWFPKSWVYRDSSGLYADDTSVVTDANSGWFSYAADCTPLFINWGCANGNCPQYSPNYSNSGFRSWWIQQAQSVLQPGYTGLWIDDVNMQMGLSTGSANGVPLDINTNQPMTQAAWAGYVADFVKQIRQQFPGIEIAHNVQWFAGDPSSNQSVATEVKAANYVNLERGFADTGLTGDNGQWSIQNMFRYIDNVHAAGSRIIAQQYDFDGQFSLAAYFLVNGGNDLFSVDAASPDNWPTELDVELGAATAARYTWNNLIRRDFANGLVLLNPPGASSVTAALPGTYKNAASGAVVTSVKLDGRTGAILLAQATEPPPVDPPVDPPPTDPPPVDPPPSNQPVPDGAYTIKNRVSGMVIDDPNWSRAGGTQMVQWNANGGSNQEWIFAYDKSKDVYSIQSQYSQLYLADVSGKLQQVKKSKNANQQWTLVLQGKYFQIQNVKTGRAITDPGASKQQGKALTVSVVRGNTQSAQWTIQ